MKYKCYVVMGMKYAIEVGVGGLCWHNFEHNK